MRFRDVPQRGKRGKIIASRNRSGPYHRDAGPHKNRRTSAQQRARGNLTALARLWNQLREDQRAAWRKLAGNVRSRPWQGQSGLLDGRQLFLKLNTVLMLCGREPLLDPPPPPQFGPNPVRALRIERVKADFAFKLEVCRQARPGPAAPLEDIMLFGWAPCSAGTDYNGNYAFLGLLRPAEGGLSDFTELFLNKLKEWRKLKDKRYHVPLEGSKIYIRAWQQVNGWENTIFARKLSALVPARTRAAGKPKAGRGGAKTR